MVVGIVGANTFGGNSKK